MTGIIDLLFDSDDYADAGDTFGEDLDLFFLTRVWYLSLCHLIVPLVSVPCYCMSSVSVFQMVFGLFMFWSVFVLQAFCKFWENQGCDISRDITRLTFWSGCHDTYNKNKRLKLPPSGRSEISSKCLLYLKKEGLHIFNASHLFHLKDRVWTLHIMLKKYVIEEGVYGTPKCSILNNEIMKCPFSSLFLFHNDSFIDYTFISCQVLFHNVTFYDSGVVTTFSPFSQ